MTYAVRPFEPMRSQDNGGARFDLVRMDRYGKPTCIHHGAMNKVSADDLWRCLHISGCRAGCEGLT